jgi:hypothetical protein
VKLLAALVVGIVIGLLAWWALLFAFPVPVGPVGPHEDDPRPVVLVR